MRFKTVLMAAAALLSAGAANATSFFRTYEAPGVLNTTVSFDFVGVETLDGRSTGYQSFNSGFGGNGMVTGTFSNIQVNPADLYGGAGGIGNYGFTGNDPFSIQLSTEVNYFGFWLSALNTGNTVTFYAGNDQIAQFDASTVFDGVQDLGLYHCNPSGTFQGQNCGEPYAFVNFFSIGGGFDRIDLSGPGVEADNFTVGRYSAGQIDVPEPGTVGLLGLGIGLAALGRRRRRA